MSEHNDENMDNRSTMTFFCFLRQENFSRIFKENLFSVTMSTNNYNTESVLKLCNELFINKLINFLFTHIILYRKIKFAYYVTPF